MIIYVEYVLIDNFCIDFMLLSAAFFTCGIRVKGWRIALTSVLGGVIALVFPLLKFHTLLLTALKLCVGLFLPLITYNFKSLKSYIRVTALFLCYTFMLGGAITGVYSLLGLNYSSELSIATMTFPAYIFIKGGVSIIKFIYRRKEVAGLCYKVRLYLNGVSVQAVGFLDTGNGVYDGFNPVIICAKDIAERFFDGGIPKIKKLRLATVNGEEQKPAFELDGIEIFTPNGTITRQKVTLCVSKSGFEGYGVILHPALFDLSGDINASAG